MARADLQLNGGHLSDVLTHIGAFSVSIDVAFVVEVLSHEGIGTYDWFLGFGEARPLSVIDFWILVHILLLLIRIERLQFKIAHGLLVLYAKALDLANELDHFIKYIVQMLIGVGLLVAEYFLAQVVRITMQQCIVYIG